MTVENKPVISTRDFAGDVAKLNRHFNPENAASKSAIHEVVQASNPKNIAARVESFQIEISKLKSGTREHYHGSYTYRVKVALGAGKSFVGIVSAVESSHGEAISQIESDLMHELCSATELVLLRFQPYEPKVLNEYCGTSNVASLMVTLENRRNKPSIDSIARGFEPELDYKVLSAAA